ncbi:MAG: hypothetical protein SGPRY_013884, partial [Prymnesium sp.]
KDYPAGSFIPNALNKNGVQLKMTVQGITRNINVHCGAHRSSKIDAAIEAQRKIEEIVGEAVMRAARSECALGGSASQATRGSPDITEEEEEWLANWYDEQMEPEKVTLEQANAALIARRLAASQGTRRSATEVLFERQWLRAKLRSAELRMEKVGVEVMKLKALVGERWPEKRARVEPAYYWEGWSEKEFRRQDFDRRLIELSSIARGKLPSEMPHGKRDGPLDHERL